MSRTWDMLARLLGISPRMPLSLRMAMVWRALSGGGALLAVRYNGGLELHDGAGHLPRDADGYYLSRTTGERLLVDEGYAAGDEVGAPKLYGLLTAVVTDPPPGSGRRTGLIASTTKYVNITLDENTACYVGCATAPAGTAGLAMFDAATTTNRFYVGRSAAGNWISYHKAGASTQLIDSGISATAGVRKIVGGSANAVGAVGAVGVYDPSTGAEEAYVTSSIPAPAFAGPFVLGLNSATGAAWAALVEVAIGWDGTAISQATMAAVAADIAAGKSVDYIRATYSPQLATDGLVCGAYDPAAPTDLFTLSGAGGAVTVVAL